MDFALTLNAVLAAHARLIFNEDAVQLSRRYADKPIESLIDGAAVLLIAIESRMNANPKGEQC